jgi:hypothetical protein
VFPGNREPQIFDSLLVDEAEKAGNLGVNIVILLLAR